MKLLSRSETNTKLAKNVKFNSSYETFGLSLAPAKESGFQVCPDSSEGCRNSCIYGAGYAGIFPKIKEIRKQKTIFFFKQRAAFKAQLFAELYNAVKWAAKNKRKLAVRLNVFSDIPWEKVFPDLFTTFPTIQFYDYTKSFKRANRFASGDFPINYHLTFSRSEDNETECLTLLGLGVNITVVFKKELPLQWHGAWVYNGDNHDLRFLDTRGVVVGLKAKGIGRKDTTGFVTLGLDRLHKGN
jgi:hypothetical protein